jgi:hypothetical protein
MTGTIPMVRARQPSAPPPEAPTRLALVAGPGARSPSYETRFAVFARPAALRSTIGAGNVVTGVLLARLATSGFYPAAVAASLPEAVTQPALAGERWGAPQ